MGRETRRRVDGRLLGRAPLARSRGDRGATLSRLGSRVGRAPPGSGAAGEPRHRVPLPVRRRARVADGAGARPPRPGSGGRRPAGCHVASASAGDSGRLACRGLLGRRRRHDRLPDEPPGPLVGDGGDGRRPVPGGRRGARRAHGGLARPARWVVLPVRALRSRNRRALQEAHSPGVFARGLLGARARLVRVRVPRGPPGDGASGVPRQRPTGARIPRSQDPGGPRDLQRLRRPPDPVAPRDTSAAAILASAAMELATA